MSVYLKKGEPTGIPSVSGDKVLFLDTDGTVKTVDSAGTKAAIGGGAGTVTTDGVTIQGDGSVGNPVAGIAASRTNAGTQSAANFKKITNYDADSWFTTMAELMRTNAPALTNFRDMKPGNLENMVTPLSGVTNDAAVVGGGVAPATNTAIAFSRSVFQTPKTTSWAIGFRAIFAAVSGTTYNIVGYSKLDNSHDIGFGVSNAVNSGATYSLTIDGAATTTVDTGVSVDGLVHDFLITFDATTVKLFIDGTQRATTTTLTNLVDEANYLYAYTHANPNTKVLRLCYGYIAP